MRRIGLLLLLPLLAAATPVPLTAHLSLLPASRAGGRAWLERAVATANRCFAGADARFDLRRVEVAAGPTEITSVAQRNALARRARRDGSLHLFLVERLANKDRTGSWIGGVHWRAGGRRYIIIGRREALPDTLAHELGHHFGLSHTRDRANLMTSPGREAGARLSAGQLARVRRRLRSKRRPR